jgi:hypothetical protein
VICPTCHLRAEVLDSRETGGGSIVRRRRKCACGSFTTYEIPESLINQSVEFTASFSLGVSSGRLVIGRSEPVVRHLCVCGNEARYAVGERDGGSWPIPRYCGLCDIDKNEGKGEPV